MKGLALSKGALTEEALKSYFFSIGYFAVRNVPFNYGGFDVTDIDLWLYLKTSKIMRERINVDIKNKKTAQALERVFWTKGVQSVLGLNRCIVATSDRRKETKEFGAKHGVLVLDGEFIQDVISKHSEQQNRISEEKFEETLQENCITKSKLIWKKFNKDSKQILITEFNYNGCNKLLESICFLLHEILAGGGNFKAPFRLLYSLTSYLLIIIDYVSRNYAWMDHIQKRKYFEEGLLYGEIGRKRAGELLANTVKLVENSGTGNLFSGQTIKGEIETQLESYPVDILSEYLMKNQNLDELFSLSLKFWTLAFQSELTKPKDLDSPLKAFIGILCDFYKIDRKDLI